jgi:hypothetical protein
MQFAGDTVDQFALQLMQVITERLRRAYAAH